MCGGVPSWVSLWKGLAVSNIIIMMHSARGTILSTSMAFAIFITVSVALLNLFVPLAVILSCAGVCLSGYILCRAFSKLRGFRGLYDYSFVYSAMEDACSAVFDFFALVVIIVSLAFGLCGLSVVLGSVILVLVYGSQMYRALSGRTLLISLRKEKQLRDTLRGTIRTLPPVDPGEQTKMNRLFERVENYMETRKPYLDSTFKIKDLSKALFTNHVYLSRTINVCSGGNFCQFVNRYRIAYAVDLIKRDPRMRVFELSLMSGFHSTVSFNMAFRLFQRESPQEYIDRMRSKLS